MEFIFLVLIVYFVIGAGVCLLICVNPNDPGIMGQMSNFLFKKLPPLFSSIIKKIFGERVLHWLGSIKSYLLQSNHPIVQIFYLIIAVGGFIAYEIKGIFKHMPNTLVGDYHVVLANLLAFICFWVYYKACAVSPGQITKQNHKDYVAKFNDYYDQIIYKKNNKCKTCHVPKPARSKHCSICKICVSKFDHHCVWIRQCVGEKNYKYFVSFLFLHSIWCLYLSVIGTLSLYQAINKMGFMRMSFKMNGQIVPASPLLAIQYLFMTETIFFFLIIMCLIMGVTLFIFVCYHFYLIAQGQTTNQRIKKNDQIDYLNKQIMKIVKIEKQITKNQSQVKEVQFRGQKVPLNDLLQFKSECSRRLAILQKSRQNKGFISNLVQIFKL